MTKRQTISGKVDDLLEEKEGEMLASAVARAIKVYQDSPSPTNFKDMQSAKKAYKEFKTMAEEELYFNKTEAFKYAERQGYPFKKSKFFNDLKYIPRKDNKFAKKEIDKHIKEKVIGASGAAVDGERKAQLEVDILEEDLRKKKLKNDVEEGKYILRSEVEQLHASKAQHLKTGLEGFFLSLSAVMVEVCGGEADKVPDLRELCLTELAKHLDGYAKPCRYSVPVITGNTEED